MTLETLALDADALGRGGLGCVGRRGDRIAPRSCLGVGGDLTAERATSSPYSPYACNEVSANSSCSMKKPHRSPETTATDAVSRSATRVQRLDRARNRSGQIGIDDDRRTACRRSRGTSPLRSGRAAEVRPRGHDGRK